MLAANRRIAELLRLVLREGERVPSSLRKPREEPTCRACQLGSALDREDASRRRRNRQGPLWFWWSGSTPPDLAEVWRAYTARFSIEHIFRFFKQTLRWATPRRRSPRAADRWTWLLILDYVQLRLARDTAIDVRLPWQPPLPAERCTPARVRRGFSQVHVRLGSPVNAPKPCGRSPGRPRDRRSLPASGAPRRSN